MIQRVFIFFLMVFITGGLFAQLEMEGIDHNSSGPLDGSTFIFYTKLYNHNKTQVTPNWERTNNDMPGGWTSQICIGDLCYAETVNEGVFIEPMYGGDTSEISVYFNNDGSTAGTGVVDLLVYDPNDSVNVQASATFEYMAYSVGMDRQHHEELSIYPNPASSSFQLKNAGHLEEGSRLEIMNMTGAIALEYSVGKADALIYDVSMLESGVYLLSVRNKYEKVILTRKLVVR